MTKTPQDEMLEALDTKPFYQIGVSIPLGRWWPFELENQMVASLELIGGVLSDSGTGFGYRDLDFEAVDEHTAKTVYFFIVNFLQEHGFTDGFIVFVQYWDGNDWEDPIIEYGGDDGNQ